MADNILDVIRGSYYDLTASEQKVAGYVLENAEAVQFMSISELAELSGVADATVTRFCRTLDLKGFNVFKIELAKCTSAALVDDAKDMYSVGAIVAKEARAAIDETVELLNYDDILRAVEFFENADRVMCCGAGGSMLHAEECAHLFSMVSPKFFSVSDSHIQLSRAAIMSENDVVVIFSYSGATKSGLELLEYTRKCKIKTVLVTRFAKSPMARLADVVLCCGSKEAPYQMGSTPAKIAQLVLADVLFREYCQRNKKEAEENIKKITSAISDKHI